MDIKVKVTYLSRSKLHHVREIKGRLMVDERAGGLIKPTTSDFYHDNNFHARYDMNL